jgi:membrane-anchored protein YejM (alkaline phosphatase superfamily)
MMTMPTPESLRPRRIPAFSAGLCAVLVAIGAASGCKPAPPPPDNFILMTLDTERADHLSCYSATKVRTPALDGLARDGILFENCTSLIPITAPSHATMFYSQPPSALKFYNNGQEFKKFLQERDKISLAGLFKKRDFATAAFVSLGVLQARFALDDGFDIYEDTFPRERWYLTAEEVNARVIPWLEAHKDKKFFLWVHYSDPHDPYAPPDLAPDLKLYLNDKPVGEFCLDKYSMFRVQVLIPSGRSQFRFDIFNPELGHHFPYPARLDALDFDPQLDQKTITSQFVHNWFLRRSDNVFFCQTGATIDIVNRGGPSVHTLVFRGRLNLSLRALRDRYRHEVEYMDGRIGVLLDKLKALGLYEKTGILAIGDHGEGLGEHMTNQGLRHFGHIHFLYNDYLKIPLILYLPSLAKRGLRQSFPTTPLDVAPTIAHLMRFNNLPAYRGRNLLRFKGDMNMAVMEETYRPEAIKDRFGVQKGNWHLIFSPEEKRYELFDDGQDAGELRNVYDQNMSLKEIVALKRLVDDYARDALNSKEYFKIDHDTEQMLKALGYVH